MRHGTRAGERFAWDSGATPEDPTSTGGKSNQFRNLPVGERALASCEAQTEANRLTV